MWGRGAASPSFSIISTILLFSSFLNSNYFGTFKKSEVEKYKNIDFIKITIPTAEAYQPVETKKPRLN